MMATAQQRQFGAALAAALDNNNGRGKTATLLEKVQKELERAEDELRARDIQIERLEKQVDYWRKLAESAQPGSTAGLNQDGRPIITPREAAKLHGVSVSTINRALNGCGRYHIEGHQLANGRWMVFVDSTLVRPERGRPAQKKES